MHGTPILARFRPYALAILATGWADVSSAPALEVTATNWVQATVYHSPQKPGYTSWCTLWRSQNGHLRLAFQQVTGPVEKSAERTNLTVILDSADDATTWKTLREVPPRKNLSTSASGIYTSPGESGFCGHGLAALPDGTLVTGLWAGGGIDTGYIQRSSDDGQTWSPPIFFLEPSKYKTWPTILRLLRDGRLVLVAGVWERQPGRPANPAMVKAMFTSADGGRTWSAPTWLMQTRQGVCEESDFAELDKGDLLFVHRTEHFEGDKYVNADRWQSLVRPHGREWVSDEPVKAPFPHSGFPELLKTREGLVLHVATDGIWWTADAVRWERLPLPGSPYYPRAMELPDGRILIVGHVGSDDVYGTVDQSIRQQTFRLKVTRPN